MQRLKFFLILSLILASPSLSAGPRHAYRLSFGSEIMVTCVNGLRSLVHTIYAVNVSSSAVIVAVDKNGNQIWKKPVESARLTDQNPMVVQTEAAEGTFISLSADGSLNGFDPYHEKYLWTSADESRPSKDWRFELLKTGSAFDFKTHKVYLVALMSQRESRARPVISEVNPQTGDIHNLTEIPGTHLAAFLPSNFKVAMTPEGNLIAARAFSGKIQLIAFEPSGKLLWENIWSYAHQRATVDPKLFIGQTGEIFFSLSILKEGHTNPMTVRFSLNGEFIQTYSSEAFGFSSQKMIFAGESPGTIRALQVLAPRRVGEPIEDSWMRKISGSKDYISPIKVSASEKWIVISYFKMRGRLKIPALVILDASTGEPVLRSSSKYHSPYIPTVMAINDVFIVTSWLNLIQENSIRAFHWP